MRWRTWLAKQRWDCSACPAVPAVGWLVSGILVAVGPGSGLPAARMLAGVFALALFWLVRPIRLRWLALLVPVGLALMALHMSAPWRTYPYLLPRQTCRVWLQGVCITPSGTSEGRYLCQLRSLATWSDPAETRCGGTVLVECPQGVEPPEYGTVVALGGTIHPPEAGYPGGLFDYRRHLWTRGILHALREETRTELGTDRWRLPARAVYRVREALADALGSRIPSKGCRGMLQAMVLGYRQRLPLDMQQDFLRSSTIHVFAISGLHVGIVAALVLSLLSLAGVRLRARGVALILVVGAYVFMCGAASSAVRAWLMLACWWGARMLRRPRVPLNAIAGAALLCLVWQPLALLQTGFLFSFSVVVVLVVGWRVVADGMLVVGERRWWLPPRLRQHRLSWWRMRPAWWLATSSLAWLGSAGMVAGSNGLLVPAGLVLNIGVIALCALTVWVSAAKIALSLVGLGLLDSVLARLLAVGTDGLHALSRMGELPGASVRICPPAAILVLVYYGLLLLALRRSLATRWRAAALAVGLGLLLLPTARQCGEPPSHRLLAGDGNAMPALLLKGGPGLPPVLVNSAGGRRPDALLEAQGIGRVEAIVFTSGQRDAVTGAKGLVARWSPRVLVVPRNWQRCTALSKAVGAHLAHGGRLRVWGRTRPETHVGGLRLQLAGRVADQEILVGPPNGPAISTHNASATGVLEVSPNASSAIVVRRQSDPVDLEIPALAPPDVGQD